jgi:integrase
MGPLYDVPIAVARDRARAFRDQLRAGIDPLNAKRETERKAVIERGKLVTFKQDAEAYIALHRPEWRSEAHAKQWPKSLATYVYPRLGDVPVSEITTPMIRQVIEPHWVKKTETMSRVLNRITMVLAYAKSHGHRQGDDPTDGLLASFPRKGKVAPVEHYAALPYAELPAMMVALSEIGSPGANALRFLILTAGRTDEVAGAPWSEIKGDVWDIPGKRMKGGRRHRVPLSRPALDLLSSMPRDGDHIFPIGQKRMFKLLKTIPGCAGATVHGMRSAFRQWCAERTAFSRNAVELSLAHKVAQDQTEDSYLRDPDLIVPRRKLMEAWATFCTTAPVEATAAAKVVPIGKARA